MIKEREEETGMIEFIINELEKIMKDQGVVSYSLQEEFKGDFENASIRSVEKIKNDDLKAKVNVPDQLTKAPLMLNYDVFDDENVEKEQMRKGSNPVTPSRKTPSNFLHS